MGLVFMSVAGATYFWGPLTQPMHPPRWLAGQFDLGFRSFPLYRSFLILCGAVLLTGLLLNAFLRLKKTPYTMSVQPLGALLFLIYTLIRLFHSTRSLRLSGPSLEMKAE